MFEKFTARARHAVALSAEEAHRFDHNYVGTEHLLLGLLREAEGAGGGRVAALEVSLDAARGKVEGLVGRGETPALPQRPFSPGAKKALELTLQESLDLGHNYIGPGHLLLGILREGRGVATRVLTELGVDLISVRTELVAQMSVRERD